MDYISQVEMDFDFEPRLHEGASVAYQTANEPQSCIADVDARLAGNSTAATVPVVPPETLAEILERLEAATSRCRRHAEMKSALRRMGEALRKPLYLVPTDPPTLRKLIAQVTPAAAGMSKERWSRVRSLVLAAMRDMGCDTQPGRDIAGHSQAWKDLAGCLLMKAQKLSLSRFMSHCTRLGIEPSAVTVGTFEGFKKALEERSLSRSPEALYRATTNAWNTARIELPRWPQLEIPLARHPHFYSFDWVDFPASFVADVENFLFSEGSQEAFSDEYVPAVRPTTTALRRRQIRQLASQLVLSGFPIEAIETLRDLVRVENVKAALQYQQRRKDGEIGVSLSQIALLASVIAKRWSKDQKASDVLRAMANRFGSKTKQKGMTPRNRDRLRQFDLSANLDALLLLPGRVYRSVDRRNGLTPGDARRAMMALAVELLTVAPMRVSNLSGLDLDRHLLVIGRGKKQVRRIFIPGEEMKTGEDFEIILPSETAAMLERFVTHYRPKLLPAGLATYYLFPGQGEAQRSTIAFSRSISDFIKRETGLIMHVHLFRHLSGKIHLDANPSDIETVRKVLGHASVATTLRHYAEHRTSHAFSLYDSTVAALRAKASDRIGKGRA